LAKQALRLLKISKFLLELKNLLGLLIKKDLDGGHNFKTKTTGVTQSDIGLLRPLFDVKADTVLMTAQFPSDFMVAQGSNFRDICARAALKA
jgi:hypothetical protein